MARPIRPEIRVISIWQWPSVACTYTFARPFTARTHECTCATAGYICVHVLTDLTAIVRRVTAPHSALWFAAVGRMESRRGWMRRNPRCAKRSAMLRRCSAVQIRADPPETRDLLLLPLLRADGRCSRSDCPPEYLALSQLEDRAQKSLVDGHRGARTVRFGIKLAQSDRNSGTQLRGGRERRVETRTDRPSDAHRNATGRRLVGELRGTEPT